MIQILKERLRPYLSKLKENKIWIGLFVICLIGSWLSTKNFSDNKPSTRELKPESLDTFIPAGHTLVPIDVQNLESLDSIFGSYGIVDLYSAAESGSKLVAEQVKLLRAPQKPSVFAVLLRSNRAAQLAANPGPYFVVVHNRGAESAERLAKRETTKHIRILNEDL